MFLSDEQQHCDIQLRVSAGLKYLPFLISIFYVIGLWIGSYVLKLSIDNIDNLTSSLNNLINNFSINDYNLLLLFQNTLAKNFKLIVLVVLFATTIIGFPLILCIVASKGYILSLLISSAVFKFKSKGFKMIFSLLIPQTIFYIPGLFLISVSSLKFSITFLLKLFGKNLKNQTLKNTIITVLPSFLIGCLLLLISSFIESYFSVNLYNLIK